MCSLRCVFLGWGGGSGSSAPDMGGSGWGEQRPTSGWDSKGPSSGGGQSGWDDSSNYKGSNSNTWSNNINKDERYFMPCVLSP